ncbi:SDR family NAD(P)-dependent oxidoreductase [Mycolicibacterium sp.]|uniref:SDR family NAD(P)-dependent oxidoreductase n=1 Tax=Mycolicibacterium sp. TaxID=2320850 RepID=UPI001A1C2238|nr:SDR family NAD(P)-dependent oxidoreductase [Mycolicibacterium sp.]MBJ7341027.1 SDR family NAD(P)-dependent oxidoreductase [Mycolicibacterium sp.]
MSNNTFLITGANAGLGKDVARQLAMRDDVDTIYLACRSEAKARLARTDLQRTTARSVFEIVIMDTADPDSVRSALDAIDTPLRAVLLNAGGTGGPKPMALTAAGVTTIFAANVLGHVVLLERLIADGMLTSTAVLTGSEAARGVPKLRIKRPTFDTHSVDEFASVIDGSYFRGKVDPLLAYGQVKYLGALWMSALARRHPDLRLLTVSPGNTSGTEALRDLPTVPRMIMQHVVMPHVAPMFGISHPLEVGAGRLVDALVGGPLPSGGFYASAERALTGPLVDQADIVADFGDETIQDRAYDAIHGFLRESGDGEA